MGQRPQSDTSRVPLQGRTGSPQQPSRFDPDRMTRAGGKIPLEDVLTIQGVAPIASIKTHILRRGVPELIVQGGTYPKVCLFRTVHAMVNGRRIMVGRFSSDPATVGDMEVTKCLIMTEDYVDEFEFVLRPDERWYACQMPGAGLTDSITVIVKDIRLIK